MWCIRVSSKLKMGESSKMELTHPKVRWTRKTGQLVKWESCS